MRSVFAVLCASMVLLVGCASGGGSDQGKFEMYIDTSSLNVVEFFFLKGRCVSRLSIQPKSDATETEIAAVGENLAQSIPLDGSAPSSDPELVALVPEASELDGWEEDLTDQIDGPWFVTKDAYSWINGAAKPFDENGFQAVAGENYNHTAEGWHLEIELVDQGSCSGAERAFRGAGWDQGTKVE